MMKITTLLFLLITSAALSQDLSLGLSYDWSGGQNFTEDDQYKVKNILPYDGVSNYISTSLNNTAIGVYANYKTGKFKFNFFATTALNLLKRNREYEYSNWDIDILYGKNKTGQYKHTSSNYLYGQYNPYYYKSYTYSHTANVFTSSNYTGVSANVQLGKSFYFGTGLNVEFRKYVITVMDETFRYESASGISLSKMSSTPIDRIQYWEVNLSVPVILTVKWIAGEIYYSANIGRDCTSTIGARIDLYRK